MVAKPDTTPDLPTMSWQDVLDEHHVDFSGTAGSLRAIVREEPEPKPATTSFATLSAKVLELRDAVATSVDGLADDEVEAAFALIRVPYERITARLGAARGRK